MKLPRPCRRILVEEHGADPERAAPPSSSTNLLKLLRQARERLGRGLRAVEADTIAESDQILFAQSTARAAALTQAS